MKITFDTKTGECKVGQKVFGYDMPVYKQDEVIKNLKEFINKNTQLSDFEEDCIWMSYRYCIGRNTIACHQHAGDIWQYCKDRMSNERKQFASIDINKEIENIIRISIKPKFKFFDITRQNTYGTYIDIICEFISEYDIKSKEELLDYKEVKVIPTDNERGYKFETITWEEWLREEVHQRLINHYQNNSFTHEQTWRIFEKWRNTGEAPYQEVEDIFKDVVKGIPNKEYYFMTDFEDLMVWSDLANLLNYKQHHKSILVDGSEAEWVWGWIPKVKLDENNIGYKIFGYEKVRKLINGWNSVMQPRVPEDIIINEIY